MSFVSKSSKNTILRIPEYPYAHKVLEVYANTPASL